MTNDEMDALVKTLDDDTLEVLDYYIGFSGKGATVLDKKPKRELTPEEIVKYADIIKIEQEFRWKCFRGACVDVIGEDPETDWD